MGCSYLPPEHSYVTLPQIVKCGALANIYTTNPNIYKIRIADMAPSGYFLPGQ